MPHFVTTIDSTWSADRAFAYMTDFSNAAEWDPGVDSARRVDSGEIRTGSAFDLTVRFAGRTLPMRYEVTEYEPSRVTFRSHTRVLESVDTVSVNEQANRTTVTYDARLSFRGVARLANPLLALGFRGIAKRATASLGRVLATSP